MYLFITKINCGTHIYSCTFSFWYEHECLLYFSGDSLRGTEKVPECQNVNHTRSKQIGKTDIDKRTETLYTIF